MYKQLIDYLVSIDNAKTGMLVLVVFLAALAVLVLLPRSTSNDN